MELLGLEKFIKDVAGLMTSSQVPRSMGVLGAAEPYWDSIRSSLGLRGWHTLEEAEEAIRRFVVPLLAAPNADSTTAWQPVRGEWFWCGSRRCLMQLSASGQMLANRPGEGMSPMPEASISSSRPWSDISRIYDFRPLPADEVVVNYEGYPARGVGVDESGAPGFLVIDQENDRAYVRLGDGEIQWCPLHPEFDWHKHRCRAAAAGRTDDQDQSD